MDADEAEEIARRHSERSGLDDRPRALPHVFAVGYLRLSLAPVARAKPHLNGTIIIYPSGASPQTEAYMIAHESAHHLLMLLGYRLDRDTEEHAASRIGCALMLPRKPFIRDALATCNDVDRLAELWPLATPRICERRLIELGLRDRSGRTDARPGLRRSSLRRP